MIFIARVGVLPTCQRHLLRGVRVKPTTHKGTSKEHLTVVRFVGRRPTRDRSCSGAYSVCTELLTSLGFLRSDHVLCR